MMLSCIYFGFHFPPRSRSHSPCYGSWQHHHGLACLLTVWIITVFPLAATEKLESLKPANPACQLNAHLCSNLTCSVASGHLPYTLYLFLKHLGCKSEHHSSPPAVAKCSLSFVNSPTNIILNTRLIPNASCLSHSLSKQSITLPPILWLSSFCFPCCFY